MRFLSCLLVVAAVTSFSSSAQDSVSPLAVDVTYPSTLQTHQRISLSGTVEAKQHAQLAPLESGRVSRLMVEVGDIVERNQPLLMLDNSLALLQEEVAGAELQAAKVNLKEAQRLYQEVLRLSEQELVAQTLIAERAAFVASAEAQVARATANLSVSNEMLSRHRLLAPFTGVIASRNADVGEWVTQQTAVLTLVAQNDLRLSVALPQQYYQYLRQHPQMNVEVTPDIPNGMPISATLNRFVPVSDNFSRTFLAQIDLPQNAPLAAGMSAVAVITVPRSEQQQIVLPKSAVKQHPDGGSSIFYVEEDFAVRVITGYTDLGDGRVAIVNQPADRAYIISGIELLKDNMPVAVANTSNQ